MLKSYSTTRFSPGVTELLLEDEVLLLLLEEEVLLLLLDKVFGFVVGHEPWVCNIEAYMLEMAWIGSINSE